MVCVGGRLAVGEFFGLVGDDLAFDVGLPCAAELDDVVVFVKESSDTAFLNHRGEVSRGRGVVEKADVEFVIPHVDGVELIGRPGLSLGAVLDDPVLKDVEAGRVVEFVDFAHVWVGGRLELVDDVQQARAVGQGEDVEGQRE
ncbi:MAG: hypothetical protein EBW87_03700, partial [Burkholderiaceae bacterium]|nr:hypothetical protein [Burkholderiaceae bacterium]